jgi:hypothetical protein
LATSKNTGSSWSSTGSNSLTTGGARARRDASIARAGARNGDDEMPLNSGERF